MTSALSSSVLSRNPESPVLGNKEQLQDGQIVDKKGTSYANHADVHAVQIRKSEKGNLYEYPIYVKGSQGAKEWRSSLQQAAANNLDEATYHGLSYSTKGWNKTPLQSKRFESTTQPEVFQNSKQQGESVKQQKPVSFNANDEEFDADQRQMMIDGALIAGNAASIGASFIPGYGNLASLGIGAATDLGQFASDWAQDGLDAGDLGNLGGNLGLSALGLIPGGGVAKTGKVAAKVAGMAGKFAKWAKAGKYGVAALYTAAPLIESATAWEKDPTNTKLQKEALEHLKNAMHAVRAAHNLGRGQGQRTPAGTGFSKSSPKSTTNFSNFGGE